MLDRPLWEEDFENRVFGALISSQRIKCIIVPFTIPAVCLPCTFGLILPVMTSLEMILFDGHPMTIEEAKSIFVLLGTSRSLVQIGWFLHIRTLQSWCDTCLGKFHLGVFITLYSNTFMENGRVDLM